MTSFQKKLVNEIDMNVVTLEEVKDAINRMKVGKLPGEDGFHAKFIEYERWNCTKLGLEADEVKLGILKKRLKVYTGDGRKGENWGSFLWFLHSKGGEAVRHS